MSYFSAFAAIVEAYTMIVLRVHYSVDVICSAIIAHYMFMFCEKYSYIVDWYIFGIPLDKRMSTTNGDIIKINPVTNTPLEGGVGRSFISCKNCQHPIGNYMVNEDCIVHVPCCHSIDVSSNKTPSLMIKLKS